MMRMKDNGDDTPPSQKKKRKKEMQDESSLWKYFCCAFKNCELGVMFT